MTIDTISERLGWIRNCNSEIKNLLLYDKRELIGKHINLIMPRVFGLEHDRLLTEYIINKNDQASTEKPVFPISKDNTFCQMTLHIKILSNNSHSLYLVGIMQPNYDIRMPSIMIDIKSLRIEGVNNDFVKFLRFKIDAKVFFSESVLAGSLLPEFSIDKFLEEKKVISYVDAAYSTNAERYECDDNSEELPSLQKRMLICLEKQITVGPVTLALASLKESGDSGEFRSQRTKIRSQMTLNSNMDTFYNILPSSKQVEKRKTANVDRMKMSDFVEDSCKKISTVKVMSNVGLGLFLVLAVGCCYL